MLIFTALLPMSMIVQTAPQPARDIVVTAQSLPQSERRLAECVARNCPVDQDVAAALAHAENQFVAGDYESSRRTLGAAMRRSGRHARIFPVEVASLSRARSRVSAHLGDGKSEMSFALDTISNLRSGLDRDDARIFVARTELGDAYVRRGAIVEAERIYRRAAREAAAAGHHQVEGFAKLRLANMFLHAAEENPSYRQTAKRAIDEITGSTLPEHVPFARAAKILEVRIAAKHGDVTEVDQLINSLRATPGAVQPVLVFAPAIELGQRANNKDTGGSMGQRVAMTDADFHDQWVDIGFYVTPDGRTETIEILRKSESNSGYWVQPILTAIAARRYSPLDLPQTDPGIYQTERFTFTARLTSTTGTRLPVREQEPRIERLDLSVNEVGK